MEAMDGPVNFGNRDNFRRCLKEGFYENTFNMQYNFPYHNELFENYGFKNYFNQYVYYKKISDGASTVAHAKALLYSLKPVIDERAIIFGYHKNEPIAFFIMIPDINQIIRGFNGKLHWFNKIRLYPGLKVFRKINRLLGLIFGVAPEFQEKGGDMQ